MVTPEQDRPARLLQNALGDSKNLQRVISGKNPRFNEILKKGVDSLDEVESQNLLSRIFSGLATEGGDWNQDRRDGAIEVLKLVDMSRLPTDFVYRTYIDQLHQINRRADPYGSVTSLLEAGKVILPVISDEPARLPNLQDAWQEVAGRFGSAFGVTPEEEYIKGEVGKLFPKPKSMADDIIEYKSDVELKNPDAQFLYKGYLKIVGEKGNFKSTLWESVPEFKSLCAEQGVKLEEFWNLSNPDQVVAALAQVRQMGSKLIGDHLGKWY